MKIILSFLLLSFNVFADSIDIITRQHINHFWPGEDLERNLSRRFTGLRYNFEKGNTYKSITIFQGNDCLSAPIYGAMYHSGFYVDKVLSFGWLAGGYKFRNEVWDRSKADQASFGEFLPIIGYEMNLKIPITEHINIKINNVITPPMTLHSIGLNFSF